MIEFKPYIHYAPELESAILGACMLESTAVGRMYGIVEAKDFYVDDNKKVCAAILEMYDKNIPIDILTVTEWLTRKEEKLNSGDVAWYVVKLTKDVVSTAHLEYHCYLVKEMWRKRELEKLTLSGIDPMGDSKHQIAGINAQLSEILGGEYKQDWYSMDELMFNLIKHQENVSAGNGNMITTGFKAIDRLNGGFWEGQLVVIGARPSMGKSALMGKIAVSFSFSAYVFLVVIVRGLR